MPAWLRLLRPKQWIKNAFVLAPLFFAGRFENASSWCLILLAVAEFLCISCTVYIFNDLRDVEEDRRHPIKKSRPLAADAIKPISAVLMACGFAAVALFVMMLLPYPCAVVAVIYLALNLLYTFFLKHIAIIDIFFIACCYVLRVLMGCYALEVIVSPWIILTTFFLALFLGFGKRYHESGFEDYAKSKMNLQHYNHALLDRLLMMSGGAALITYAIYAAEISQLQGRTEFVYTVAFVAFGLFRYLQSVYVYNQGGEPEVIIFRDKLQLANIVAWFIVTLWILF